MKKYITAFLTIVTILMLVGCNSETPKLCNGQYNAVGDYEEFMTPYIELDTDKNEFRLCAGAIVSYSEYGTYKETKGTLIATTQNTTFTFEIKNEKTLVLIDNGGYVSLQIPINTQFVFNN